MREGGGINLNILKGAGIKNRGGETNILKRGWRKLSQRVGPLKRGLRPPCELMYELACINFQM